MNQVEEIFTVLESIPDPEIPVLSIVDLGIVRHAQVSSKGIEIKITPTYSGCPAMHLIETEIKFALEDHFSQAVYIETVLSPAWTTDWLSPHSKEKLRQYGIAPPTALSSRRIQNLLGEFGDKVLCARCGSSHTECLSSFGSTACKALYRCKECLEPFDYFKCH